MAEIIACYIGIACPALIDFKIRDLGNAVKRYMAHLETGRRGCGNVTRFVGSYRGGHYYGLIRAEAAYSRFEHCYVFVVYGVERPAEEYYFHTDKTLKNLFYFIF